MKGSSRGSSPHARGTRPWPRSRGCDIRFIPACAGNTDDAVNFHPFTPVHPRMRGEHRPRIGANAAEEGSSPHARGTPIYVCRRDSCGRFIPACAGNTTAYVAQSSRSSVHPRMRGEHADTFRQAGIDGGSSPHARGTRHMCSRRRRRRRFIPACAGNTFDAVSHHSAPPVHPRMRGEHAFPCAKND